MRSRYHQAADEEAREARRESHAETPNGPGSSWTRGRSLSVTESACGATVLVRSGQRLSRRCIVSRMRLRSSTDANSTVSRPFF